MAKTQSSEQVTLYLPDWMLRRLDEWASENMVTRAAAGRRFLRLAMEADMDDDAPDAPAISETYVGPPERIVCIAPNGPAKPGQIWTLDRDGGKYTCPDVEEVLLPVAASRKLGTFFIEAPAFSPEVTIHG